MNPLTDALSPKWRKRLYAIVFVALLVYTAIQAADSDWMVALGSLLTSLAPLLAASNVTPGTLPDDYDDGSSYDEAGGNDFPEVSGNGNLPPIDPSWP